LPRPLKLRCIARMPWTGYFWPDNPPREELESVCLSLEEVEALRLKDLEGLEQEASAQRMRISRPTFHRILEMAHEKVADALVNGKAIQIEGGNFGLPQSRFICNEDGHEWNVPFDVLANGDPISCPNCSSMNIQPEYPTPSFCHGGGGRGRFRRGRRH
jgi:predicted DNA-binding protein (UPF0251 family)